MVFWKKHNISLSKSDNISEYLNYKKKINSSGKLCHAPYSSLRFSISGNVQACCFNRLLLLGKYPKDNLLDIWNGENAKKIRDSIQNNDLGMGCGYCSEGIKTGNYRSVGAYNYEYLKLPDNNWPVMLDFELGNNCNLECIMCNGENSALIRQKRENETPYKPPYDENFVKQLEPFIHHLTEARFVGGEPFLIEINYKIWEKIIEINPKCKITVLTNGTVLNDRIRLLLAKGNFNISVSADGISKEVYEKIRINADYNIFMQNLKFFINYSITKKNSFFWNFCPMRLNWHEIPEVFTFCNKENINIILHTIIFPPNTALWNLPLSELDKIRIFLINHKPNFSNYNKAHKHNLSLYNSLINQFEDWIDKKNKSENLTGLNIEELKKVFYTKISEYVSESKIYSASLNTEMSDSYILKLENIFKQLDNISLIKVLTFLLSINIELIIAEIVNSTDEKLKQRILTAAN